jgi:probable rRNA maturation factor
MPVQISIVSHREPEQLDLTAFERLAEFVLDRESAPAYSELSIAIVDLTEMTSLNEQYRGKSGPTDVLSFECDDLCAATEPDEPITLGDVVIAPEVAEVQAAEYGHTVEQELNLLLVHGILHLLGYDHEDDGDADAMQARERAILTAWDAAG